jgi:hypothetical protein
MKSEKRTDEQESGINSKGARGISVMAEKKKEQTNEEGDGKRAKRGKTGLTRTRSKTRISSACLAA